MKFAMTLLGLMLISFSASAAGGLASGRILSFVIDWNQAQSLEQGDNIGCDGDHARVEITVLGQLSKDFDVRGPGGSCMLVSKRPGGAMRSLSATTLTYEGDDCFSDNDQNFFVDQLGPDGQPTGKVASITADSGC